MKKLVLSCTALFISGILYSQEYAYAFKGTLSTDQQESIKRKILALPDVKSCDLKIKSEKQVGEFLFYVEPKLVRSEQDSEFSPVQIKTILLENNLEPLDFRQIK